MFDEDFSFIIEQKYPYPIAVAFRRLETDEYMEKGAKRLKGVLEVAERTLHLLAHVVLIGLFEDSRKAANGELPKGLTADFEKKFGALSFGSLIQYLREGIRTYKEHPEKCFVPELYPFYFDASGKPTEAAQAFDALVAVRNKLAHPTQQYTAKELADFCGEAEGELTKILEGLGFLTKYELLNVNQIEVIKKRSKEATFKHRFSKIVGVSENFKAREDSFPVFMDSHAMVLKKKETFDYLDLSPLVIYSAEGEKQVPDVFLYLGQKGAGYIYSACNNGGAFDSRQSSLQNDLQEEMKALLQAFASKGN